MKTYCKYIAFISIILLGCSCSSLRRYSSSEPSGINNHLADVNLFAFRLSDSGSTGNPKTLWDLSADAQSQFIKILNSRFPDNEDFIKALSYRYTSGPAETTPDDYVKRNLRMIFSVSRQRNYGERDNRINLTQADRIEYLKITLSLPDNSKMHFCNWNMFTTEYGSIDIADVSFSRSLDLEASALLAGERKSSSSELSSGGKAALSSKEEQAVRYRYLKLNGRINRSSIEMEEEGTREIDLTGNIAADVSLEFDHENLDITRISGLTDSSGQISPPEKIRLTLSETRIPKGEPGDTIFARLRIDYVFRNVVGGQKTFPEWDDRVRYFTGSVSKNIPLLSTGDYKPEFYTIGYETGSSQRVLLTLSSGNKIVPLVVRSASEAAALLDWLTSPALSAKPGTGRIIIDGYTLLLGTADLGAARLKLPGDLKILRL